MRRLLLLLLLLLPLDPALADGGYFKSARMAVVPSIPAQRALIVHRDGVERLVVESTVDAEAQALGWIVPLPARPTSVEAATPGILDTLDVATRATVPPDGMWLEVLLLPGLLLLLGALLILHRAQVAGTAGPGSPALRIALLLGLLFSLLFLVAVPNLLAARLGIGGAPVTGVEATASRRIGSYDVVVLEAKDASALGAWLEGAGLAPLAPEAIPVIEAHVSEGWVFLAARLAHEGGGRAAPHPLSVTFPAERPVYPMRLTGLAGGGTDLRIHVVAAGWAAGRPLRVTRSRRFEGIPDGRVTGDYTFEERPMLSDGDGWEGRRIAHPDLMALLWDGCVVTRLEGRMEAAAMDRDLLPEVGEYRPVERLLRTPGEAWRAAGTTVSLFWCLGLLVLLLTPARLLAFPGEAGLPHFRWIGLLTVGAVAATAGLRASMETIPAEELRSSRWIRMPALMVLDDSDGYAGRTLEEARAALEAAFRKERIQDPFAGGPVRWGDSPGCVELFEDHRGPVLRVWSLEGAPVERAWHEARVENSIMHHRFQVGPGPFPTVVDLRERLHDQGLLLGGLRNPFTGDLLREGTGPGDVEILITAEKKLLLRLHGRAGRTTDIDLRR